MSAIGAGAEEAGGASPVRVMLKTSEGNVTIELAEKEAPVTVSNFLAYVDARFYDETLFHRVIDGFMIQGGGFTVRMERKTTRGPIRNEAANGLKNVRGTVAMARTSDVDSATAQFFINVSDNAFLDHRSPDPAGFGYCVFGRVVEGMDTVDRIKAVRTGVAGGMKDVPVKPVTILEASRVPAARD